MLLNYFIFCIYVPTYRIIFANIKIIHIKWTTILFYDRNIIIIYHKTKHFGICPYNVEYHNVSALYLNIPKRKERKKMQEDTKNKNLYNLSGITPNLNIYLIIILLCTKLWFSIFKWQKKSKYFSFFLYYNKVKCSIYKDDTLWNFNKNWYLSKDINYFLSHFIIT